MTERDSFINKRIYKRNLTYAILLTLIITLPSIFFVGYYVARANPGSTPVFEHPGGPYSYLVWDESGTYYAKSFDGAIDYSGASLTTVGQNAIDNIGDSRMVFLFIGYNGASGHTANFDLTAQMTVLRGLGMSTWLRGTGDHTISVTGEDSMIRDMWIDQNDGAGNYDAININTNEVHIDNVDIDEAARDGIRVETGNTIGWINDVRVQLCKDYLIRILGSNFHLSNIFLASPKGDRGLYITRGTLTNVIFEQGDSETYAIYLVERVVATNLRILSANATALYLSGNDNEVHGVYVDITNTDGIVVSGNNSFISGGRVKSAGRYGLNVGGNNNTVYITESGAGTTGVLIGAGATNNNIWGTWSSLSDSGTRTLINGVGTNNGDPSSAGDWNGNGREGAIVWDTNTWAAYQYVSGAWRTI